MSKRNLDRIAAALVKAGVKFVAVGGWAIETQMSKVPYPPTQDIDIAPDRSRENRERLSAALTDLDALIRTDEGDAFRFNHDAASFETALVRNLVCDLGDFDLTFEPSEMGAYEDMIGTAQPVALTVDGIRVVVMCADLEAIYRSKKSLDRPKDQAALRFLEQALGLREGKDDKPMG